MRSASMVCRHHRRAHWADTTSLSSQPGWCNGRAIRPGLSACGRAAVIVKTCTRCGQRFPEDLIVRRRPCLRVYERERSRARRQRASAQQRTLAVSASAAGAAGSFDQLEVHHEVPIAKGGRPDVLDNLVTLCVACHRRRRQGDGSRSWLGPSHTPSASTSRETPQPRRASRGTSSARHDCDRVVG
jgi:HNH endonuclease